MKIRVGMLKVRVESGGAVLVLICFTGLSTADLRVGDFKNYKPNYTFVERFILLSSLTHCTSFKLSKKAFDITLL